MNNKIKDLGNGDFEVEKEVESGVLAKTADAKKCSCDCGGCAKGVKSK